MPLWKHFYQIHNYTINISIIKITFTSSACTTPTGAYKE